MEKTVGKREEIVEIEMRIDEQERLLQEYAKERGDLMRLVEGGSPIVAIPALPSDPRRRGRRRRSREVIGNW